MSNLDPICVSIISMLLGILGGAFVTIVVEEIMIKRRDTRNAIAKFSKIFRDLWYNFATKEIPYSKHLSTFVEESFPITDKAIDEILFYVDKVKILWEKICAAYKKYKDIDDSLVSEKYPGPIPIVYNSAEKEFKEYEFNIPGVKTGKYLLLYNLQQIIDLTKWH